MYILYFTHSYKLEKNYPKEDYFMLFSSFKLDYRPNANMKNLLLKDTGNQL